MTIYILHSSLQKHCRTLCCFQKTYKTKQPSYLFSPIPGKVSSYIPVLRITFHYSKFDIISLKTLFSVDNYEVEYLDTTTRNTES